MGVTEMVKESRDVKHPREDIGELKYPGRGRVNTQDIKLQPFGLFRGTEVRAGT